MLLDLSNHKICIIENNKISISQIRIINIT